jgi:hypothetical protein
MKKRSHLKKIALMGMAGGLILAQSKANAHSDSTTPYTHAETAHKALTEAELLSKLNAEGKAAYQGLDTEGKSLALKLASQSCKGQNDCKGLNSCKAKTNSCAGEGSCKGTSPGAFTDKNDAVKAAQKMAKKRAGLNSGQ